MIFGGLVLVYSLPKLFLAARLYLKNGTLEGSLQQVAKVLLRSMAHAGLLNKNPDSYDVKVEASVSGNRNVILEHASRAEERIFFDALSEVLGPIENPRYLLVRDSWIGGLSRRDYHNVPSIFGGHRDTAAFFTQNWNRLIGPSKQVFTRQKGGRKILLQARSSSMAAGFQRFVDRRSQWR